jgi:hypothetical protein
MLLWCAWRRQSLDIRSRAHRRAQDRSNPIIEVIGRIQGDPAGAPEDWAAADHGKLGQHAGSTLQAVSFTQIFAGRCAAKEFVNHGVTFLKKSDNRRLVTK